MSKLSHLLGKEDCCFFYCATATMSGYWRKYFVAISTSSNYLLLPKYPFHLQQIFFTQTCPTLIISTSPNISLTGSSLHPKNLKLFRRKSKKIRKKSKKIRKKSRTVQKNKKGQILYEIEKYSIVWHVLKQWW